MCAQRRARVCLLISPRDTHSQHTVRRARLLCLWLQWSSGSSDPVGKDSFHFYAQLFLRRRASVHVSPRPPSTVVDVELPPPACLERISPRTEALPRSSCHRFRLLSETGNAPSERTQAGGAGSGLTRVPEDQP